MKNNLILELEKNIKNNFPFVETFYLEMVNARNKLSYLLPVSIRLKKGMRLTVNERRRMVQRLYKQKEEQPLFSGKNVLLWEPAPWTIHIAFISSIGTALALRGCCVELVICDGATVACMGREIRFNESFSDWNKRCPGCYKACRDEANSFGIKTVGIGELVNSETLSELREISQTIELANIRSYSYKGINVGVYALSSLIRYYQGKVIEFEENLLREYLFGALVITDAAINKIDSFKPDAIYMSHGTYTSWGPALMVAMKRGIPVIKIGGGYRKQYSYFHKIVDITTNISYGTLSDLGWKKRLKEPLSTHEEQILENYLNNRYMSDSRDFLDIRMSPRFESKQSIFNELGITDKKPIWCIFTHLNWDTSVSTSRMAFGDYNEWIVETLNIIRDVPDVQWLIKIHPAEKWWGCVEGVEKIINGNFPDLPPQIKVIPPDADINTYNLLNVITGGVTCKGTVGLELAAMGKPVIVAAEAYYSQKGFTYDGLSPVGYEDLLRKTPEIPPFLTPEQKEKTRKFAYSYFIQRQIPLRMFKTSSEGRFSSFDWRKVESLLPCRDPVVDMICERFFEGDDFILDDETIREVAKL